MSPEKPVIRRGPNVKKLSEAKKYGTCLSGRYAGDGIVSQERGGGMRLTECDWCGKLYNFRNMGHRICNECWENRGKLGGSS